jgi:hypothetical protein
VFHVIAIGSNRKETDPEAGKTVARQAALQLVAKTGKS